MRSILERSHASRPEGIVSGTDLQVETSTRRAYCPECGEEFPANHEHCPHDGTLLYLYNGPDEEDELLNTSLDGRFKLHKVLGEGGMGKVYAGTQLSVDRDVAIKVLRKELSNDPEVVKRFFREGRVISGLSHHNIVNLVDFGQDPDSGVLFLAMEMLDGRDMSELLGGQRMKPKLALECVRQTCAGLSQAHAQFVVHRDLKPENLFIVAGSDGGVQVKILDFGIARALKTNTRLTKTGMVFGTPQYMPPEQSSGGEIGPHTDIYALGVILFEALTGRLPFVGETPTQVMLAHIRLEPPSLRTYLSPAELPDEIVELVDAMLAKEPAERPQSVLDVRDAIEAVQREHSMLPVRVATQGEFEERFAVLLEASKSARKPATSGAMLVDTGTGEQKYRTDPPNSPPRLGLADTAALNEPSELTEPVVQAKTRSSKKSKTGFLSIAAVIVLLVVAASAAAVYLPSSKTAQDPIKPEHRAAPVANDTRETARPAEPTKARLTTSMSEASEGMLKARASALEAVDDPEPTEPSASPKPDRVEAKPDRPPAAPSVKSENVAKPSKTSARRPVKQPTAVAKPKPKTSNESKENQEPDALNFFPVE